MPAFPPFKAFGDNTNPQGPGAASMQGGQLGSMLSGFNKSVQQNLSGKGQPKPMGPGSFSSGQAPAPPGMGVNPMNGFANLNKQLAQSASALSKPGQSGSVQAGGVGMGGSTWDRPRVGGARQLQPSMRDAVGGAMLGDAQLAQKANDFNWGRNEAGRNAFLQGNDESVARMRQAGQDAAGGMDRAGQEAYDASVGAADGNFDRIMQRVNETEARHNDRTAQDIAQINQGIMSQRGSQLSQQIDEMGLAGADPNDPQVAQVKADFQAETMRMRQSAATELVSRNNEFRASFEQGNTQILAGVGSDSAQMKFQAAQQLAAYRANTEQFRYAVEGAALDRKLQGDMAGYEMLTQNPYSPMGLSAVLASMMEMIDSGAGKYGNPLPALMGGGN